MKKIISVLIALLIVLSLASCAKPPETIEVTYAPDGGEMQNITMKLASNTKIVSYLLYVPQDWIIKDQSASTVAYVSEENKTSVSVTQWNLTSEFTSIDAWWDLHKKENEATMPAFTVLREGDALTVNGVDAKSYRYTVTFSGGTYVYEVVSCITQGSVHVFTYTSTEALFSENLDVFYSVILENFKFN